VRKRQYIIIGRRGEDRKSVTGFIYRQGKINTTRTYISVNVTRAAGCTSLSGYIDPIDANCIVKNKCFEVVTRVCKKEGRTKQPEQDEESCSISL
jgi:hypothetical protein